MSQILPDDVDRNSPDELILLLDSLISSSLCAHTKEYICFLYQNSHRWVSSELGVYIWGFQKGGPFVRYENSPDSVPLELTELASRILDLKRPYTQITSLEQAQLWKLTNNCPEKARLRKLTNSWWRRMYRVIGKYTYPNSSAPWKARSPALWLALKGKFTLGDFLGHRSFTRFIEQHWERLLSQSNPTSLKEHWQVGCHPDGRGLCQCPGYELSLLLDELAPQLDQFTPQLASRSFASLGNSVAKAVLMEIMSHIDPRILQFLEPDLSESVDRWFQADKFRSDDWYKPNSPEGRWKSSISEFKALADVLDRLVAAFELIRNDPQIASIVQAQLSQDCDLLASQIKKQ